MPDASMLDPDVEPQAASVTTVSGGVNLDAQRDVNIGGDVVGRDKITTIGYTVEQVNTLLEQISHTFQPKPFDGRCPYLGLDAFSEDDADRFFGRESLMSELVTRVKESRYVVIGLGSYQRAIFDSGWKPCYAINVRGWANVSGTLVSPFRA